MVTDWGGDACERDRVGGGTVTAGLTLIGLGVGSAVWFQHLDSVVWGAFMVLIGLCMLGVNEVRR